MNDTVSVLTSTDRGELATLLGERARFDENLARHTWWKVGGPADALLDIHSSAELQAVLEFARRRRLAWFVLGNGSNILVGDGGMRGLVLRLGGDFAEISFADGGDEVRVTAGGAASLAVLTGQAATRGALGADGLAGVPATVGGAVRMNAGTDREIGEFVRRVWIQTLSRSEPHAVALQYVYRRSTLAADAIIARVELAFTAGDPAIVREQLRERLVRRKATQPVAQPNAGSCFRNPPNDRAGRLIEAAGAKGWHIGGAQVSPLHANFIINTGTATAEDIACLLTRVRTAVEAHSGVALELEVHFVGVFTAASAVA